MGVPTHRSTAELLDADKPDFVIVSIPWAVTPDATREAVRLGARVLVETPPAPDLEAYAPSGATSAAAAWFRLPSSIF